MGKEWMTQAEAAEWLAVSEAEVREGVARGDLPALRLGTQVRLSRSALIGHASGAAAAITPEPLALPDGRLRAPAAFEWKKELTETAEFEHAWPDGTREIYPRAWSGAVSIAKTLIPVKVGVSTGAERRDGIPRMTVFLMAYPTVEFVPTVDGLGWASLIKPDGRHTVPLGTVLPTLYQGARVEPYHDATGLSGRGRSTGAALVIDRDDLTSAIHHAAARWLGSSGRPVEAAV